MTDYQRPGSLDEAVRLLDAAGSARLLAGGTDLINEMRLGVLDPPLVVDTVDLAELHELRFEGDRVVLGAAVTMRRLLGALPPGRLAALRDAADLLGGRQIQAVATLGGNLCHASPAAETATPMLVHEATARIAGPRGRRELPVTELWAGPRRTVLGPGELLVDLVVAPPAAGWASAYRRVELRQSVDIALVSASAAVRVSDGVLRAARIALGAAGPVPFRVPAAEAALDGVRVELSGGVPTGAFAEAVAAAGELCATAARPITDVRAGADYRRAMVAVVVRRALTAAVARA